MAYRSQGRGGSDPAERRDLTGGKEGPNRRKGHLDNAVDGPKNLPPTPTPTEGGAGEALGDRAEALPRRSP